MPHLINASDKSFYCRCIDRQIEQSNNIRHTNVGGRFGAELRRCECSPAAKKGSNASSSCEGSDINSAVRCNCKQKKIQTAGIPRWQKVYEDKQIYGCVRTVLYFVLFTAFTVFIAYTEVTRSERTRHTKADGSFPCDNDWHFVRELFICIRVSSDRVTWDEALYNCKGHLASLASERENEMIYKYLEMKHEIREPLWIGGYSRDDSAERFFKGLINETEYRWVDYTHWKFSKVNSTKADRLPGRLCLTINPEREMVWKYEEQQHISVLKESDWTPKDCRKKYGYICKGLSYVTKPEFSKTPKASRGDLERFNPALARPSLDSDVSFFFHI
ncbi:hypothetical protein QR680_008324 [Steinernema hermaphroditum]|uniref:C-type lectin domain-containing protein n=1 Tax=Steinernema hermaphroditum TaxID=289476 RepID=A0AA39IHP2_9BILA|nr:hypothetical protein QR680_008324 [Steinernema hermaphroditum]